MRKEVKNFNRQYLFDHFNQRENPFIMLTTKVDVTKVYDYCKINKRFYATMTYLILSVVNEMDCFKYRCENEKIYKYDKLRANMVEMYNENEIGFMSFYEDNLNDFKNTFIKKQKEFKEKHIIYERKDEGEVWFSCTPKFTFSQLVVPYDKNITIPQFIWDKVHEENEKMVVDLMVLVHHGFADGNHISMFLEKLQNKINNFNELI